MAIERLNELYPGEREAGEYAVVGDDIVNDLGAGTTELGLRRILGEWHYGIGQAWLIWQCGPESIGLARRLGRDLLIRSLINLQIW